MTAQALKFVPEFYTFIVMTGNVQNWLITDSL